MVDPFTMALAIVTLLDAVVLVGVLSLAWRNPVARRYGLFMATILGAAVFQLLELGAPGRDVGQAYHRLGLLGFCLLPAAYLSFVQHVSGRARLSSARVERYAILGVGLVLFCIALFGRGIEVDLMPAPGDLLRGNEPLYRHAYGFLSPIVLVLSYRHLAQAARDRPAVDTRLLVLLVLAGILPIAGRELIAALMPGSDALREEAGILFASLNGLVAGGALLGSRVVTRSLARAIGTLGEVIGEALLLVQRNRIVSYGNATALRLFGADVVSQRLATLFSDPRRIDEICTQAIAGQPVSADVEAVRPDGTSVPVSLIVTANCDDRGEVGAWVVTARDMTDARGQVLQLKEAQARLESAALTDPLTGLRNRRYLLERLREECARSRRYGQAFAVAMLDLDGFKPINDRYGHAAGDAVLVQVGLALRRAVRESDLVARIGGDEFVVILLEARQDSAGIVAARLAAHLAAIRTEFSPDGVRASIGIAFAPAGATGMTPEDLLERADAAMYEEKRSRGSGRSVAPVPPPAAPRTVDVPNLLKFPRSVTRPLKKLLG